MNNAELRDRLLALLETGLGHKIKVSQNDREALADEAPNFLVTLLQKKITPELREAVLALQRELVRRN